ncbi:MAG: hypothetical protein ACYTEZ_11445 [Planctomycetota bacterium]|jgi:hypothetical protein
MIEKVSLGLLVLLLAGCRREEGTLTFYSDKYEVVKPASWSRLADLNEAADVQMGNRFKEAYLVILTEAKVDFEEGFTLADFSDVTRGFLRQSATKYSETGPEPGEVNGKPSLRYEIHATVDRVRIRYWHICIDFDEEYHQVIVWSLVSRFDDNVADFDRALYSLQKRTPG